MKTILLDLDGVVIDLHAVWLARYNADYGDALTSADITTWDMLPHIKPECGKRIYEYLHAPDLYDAVDPVDGASDGVAALRHAGHRVVFVTSCVSPTIVKAKAEWLYLREFLRQPIVGDWRGMNDFAAVQDKGLMRGDLMIDDYPANLEAFGGHSIIFDAPWNRDDGPAGATRIDGRVLARACGWPQVVSLAREVLA